MKQKEIDNWYEASKGAFSGALAFSVISIITTIVCYCFFGIYLENYFNFIFVFSGAIIGSLYRLLCKGVK